MPACGQAVGCGVCDTPELWCGAAGLCARVRACAGAAESLYIHTYIHKRVNPNPLTRRVWRSGERRGAAVGGVALAPVRLHTG